MFGDGGIRRLQTEGAWFQNCNYPYADTVTATGHASMLTGCSPDRHGIIGNEWYDREAGAEVSCVASDRYRRVPPAGANATGKKSAKEGASPERLLAPTVGDVLKEATGGRARVVSLSFKDRSAVLPAGRHPDACYWFSGSTAEAITSTYYRDRIHSWVADFNRAHQVDQWFHKEWTRLRPELDYAHFSGPDDVAGEGNGSGQGRTFPHPFGAADKSKPTSSYYGALYNSPFANEVLLNLVERAIDAEHLGTQDTPDLLCVSFSSNDAIGHCYGPDSQEVLDVTLRSDLIVRDLLNYLDAKVGKGCYVLALTADHGVCPLPEVVRAQGKDAGRIIPSAWPKQANAFLKETFARKEDKSNWIEAFSPPWIYLNKQVLRKQGLKEEEVERALANWLVKQPGIQSAYTRTQLLGELPKDDAVGRTVQRSFYPAQRRSGWRDETIFLHVGDHDRHDPWLSTPVRHACAAAGVWAWNRGRGSRRGRDSASDCSHLRAQLGHSEAGNGRSSAAGHTPDGTLSLVVPPSGRSRGWPGLEVHRKPRSNPLATLTN